MENWRAEKELYVIGWILSVHAMYQVCAHQMFWLRDDPKVARNYESMAVSPCLDMATLPNWAYPSDDFKQ